MTAHPRSFHSHRAIKSMTTRLVGRLEEDLGPQLRNTAAALQRAWSDPLGGHGLVSDVVLEGGFGYAHAGRTLREFCADGVLDPGLLNALAQSVEEYRVDPESRHPYVHQENAWRALAENHSPLVSAGTGSGKTECFLYPILSSLFAQQRAAHLSPGVQALFLYPTNALINSQRDRLAAWLGTPANTDSMPIRFALYNSALPEEPEGTPKLRVEVGSREELRKTPPPIVITNYSMLEIALIRPADQPIFQASRGRLRYVVLDEAHTYQGIMSAEIALLLRRTLDAFEVEPSTVRFIATSATFPGASHAALADFAAGLFGIRSSSVRVVEGRRAVPDVAVGDHELSLPDPETLVNLVGDEGTFVMDGDRVRLDDDKRTTARFAARLSTAGLEVRPAALELPAAQMLWEVLRGSQRLMSLRALLGERQAVSLRVAAEHIFSRTDVESIRATAELLDLASLARLSLGEQALIPTRWHVAYRRIERLSVCLSRACPMRTRLELPLEWILGGVHPIPIPRCGCNGIVLPLNTCQNCGEPFLSGDEKVGDGGLPRLHAPAPEHLGSLFRFRAEPQQGDLGLHPETGDLYDAWEDGLIPVRRCGERCPRCGAESERDTFARYVGHTRQTAVSVLLEGLFDELPVDLRDPDARPNGGRRLIMFSDSRQIAAQLAPLVERSLRERAVRQVILRQLAGPDSPEDRQLRALLARLEGPERDALAKRIGAGRPMTLRELGQQIAQDAACRQQLLAAGERLREIDGRLLDIDGLDVEDVAPLLLAEVYRRLSLPRSLESMGLIEVRYPPLATLTVPSEHGRWFTNEDWRAMVATLVDSTRARGGTLLHGDAAEVVPQYTHGKLIGHGGERTWAVPWLGRSVARWLAAVLHARKLPTTDAAVRTLADDLWKSVRATAVLISQGDGFLVNADALTLCALEHAYCDPRTGTAYPRSLDRISPASGEAELVEFRWPIEMGSGQALSELSLPSAALTLAVHRLLDRRAPSIRAVEHTAQISVERLREYERLFREGKRNLLSSTTTMEMGVDIGQLPAVLLTNAPPSPANYLQRAGRAGRRNEGCTLIVSLTSSSPHDSMLFERPSWAFEERGPHPTVRLDREVVVQRHVNAALLRFAGLTRADIRNPLGTLGSCGDFFLERDPGVVAPVDRLVQWLEQSGLSGESEFWATTESKISQLAEATALHGYAPQQLGGAAAKQLRLLRDEWRQVDAIITESIESEAAAGELRDAARLKDVREQRRRSFLLAYLAERQFLPRYGFPIDVISLDSGPSRGRISEHRLERGLEIGLREYGPGSEVIVGAAKLPSRGLLLGPRQQYTGSARGTNELRQLTLRQCRECRFLAVDLSPTVDACPSCGQATLDEPRNGVRPNGFSCELRYGDVVGKTRAVEGQTRLPYLPPIFSPSRDSEWRVIVPGLEARYTRDGRVVHRSDGMDHRGFDLCSICGRAESRDSDGRRAFTKKDGSHSMLRVSGKPCAGRYSDATLLERVSLVHPVYTDTLEIRLTGPLDPGPALDEVFATTLSFALRDAAASHLGTSPREIGAQAYRSIDDSTHTQWGVVLFDQVAGGAGFMEDVRGHLPMLVGQAVKRLRGDALHDVVCQAACPKCLLSYQTQFHVDKLNRQVVLSHFSEERLQHVEAPPELTARFGVSARPLPDGIDAVINWLRDAESAVAYLGSSSSLASNPIFRAMIDLCERGRSAEVLVDDMPTPTPEGEFVDRPSVLLFERFLTDGGNIRVIEQVPPRNVPVAIIRRHGVDHVLGSLADGATSLPLGATAVVDGLSSEHARLLQDLPGRLVGASELHPTVVRIVEVVKEQLVERLVPTPNTTARVNVPSAIGGTWREVLDHVALHTERQLRVRPPFHQRDREPSSVAYSDRYLRSERSLRSLHALLVAVGARPSAVAVHVATLPPEQAGKGLADDYRSAKDLAAAWNQIAPGRRSLSLREVPHSRTMNLHYSDGAQWLIDLDEGVNVFQERSRGNVNRAFLVHVTLARPAAAI